LWERKDKLEDLGVSIMIVTFESMPSVSAYSWESGITWPVILDERLHLYKRYKMYRAGFWDLWGPSTWWAYLKQLLKGNLPQRASGDIHQRGGDVLIDDKGIIQLHHVGKGPADRPSVASILEVVVEANGACERKAGKEKTIDV